MQPICNVVHLSVHGSISPATARFHFRFRISEGKSITFNLYVLCIQSIQFTADYIILACPSICDLFQNIDNIINKMHHKLIKILIGKRTDLSQCPINLDHWRLVSEERAERDEIFFDTSIPLSWSPPNIWSHAYAKIVVTICSDLIILSHVALLRELRCKCRNGVGCTLSRHAPDYSNELPLPSFSLTFSFHLCKELPA